MAVLFVMLCFWPNRFPSRSVTKHTALDRGGGSLIVRVCRLYQMYRMLPFCNWLFSPSSMPHIFCFSAIGRANTPDRGIPLRPIGFPQSRTQLVFRASEPVGAQTAAGGHETPSRPFSQHSFLLQAESLPPYGGPETLSLSRTRHGRVSIGVVK